jgi:hypothetical protein
MDWKGIWLCDWDYVVVWCKFWWAMIHSPTTFQLNTKSVKDKKWTLTQFKELYDHLSNMTMLKIQLPMINRIEVKNTSGKDFIIITCCIKRTWKNPIGFHIWNTNSHVLWPIIYGHCFATQLEMDFFCDFLH